MTRHVRTPEGARRFGQPIGSVIVADHAPDVIKDAEVITEELARSIFEGEYADGFKPRVTAVRTIKGMERYFHPGVQPNDGSVKVAGSIYHAEDPFEAIGRFSRTFRPKDRVVVHQNLELAEEYRRHGFATEWMKHTEAAYYALGYRRIEVQAGDADGPIVWAKMGYRFDKDQLPIQIYLGMHDYVIEKNDEFFDRKTNRLQQITADERERMRDLLARVAHDDPPVTPLEIFAIGPAATTLMMVNGWQGFKDLDRPQIKAYFDDERIMELVVHPSPVPDTTRDADRAEHSARLDRWETMLTDVLERFYSRQMEVVIARLRGKQARKGTRHWTGSAETKDIDTTRVLDPSRWRTEIEDDASRVVLGITRGAMSAAAQDLDTDTDESLDLDIDGDDIADAIREKIQRIMSTTEARAERVRQIIMDADTTGADLDEIVSLVRGTYDQRRIWAATTARQEVAGIVNGGSFNAAKRVGATLKAWLSSHDERVRDTHRIVDGQVVGIDSRFIVGGFPMRYPGDYLGPIEETINCRCVLLFDREVPREPHRPDITPDPLIGP